MNGAAPVDRERTPATPPHDHDSAGYLEATQRGELAVQVCRPAGHVLHLPRGYCHRCDTFDVTWRPVAPTATVHTWTTVEHAVDPAFPVPYTIVLVEVDELPGVRFVGHLSGRPELTVGTPMAARFERGADGSRVPTWELA